MATRTGSPRISLLRLTAGEYRQALVLAMLAAVTFALMDAMVKITVAVNAVAVMGTMRYIVQITVVLAVVRASTGSLRALRPVSLHLQLLRGLLLLGSTVAFWSALQTVPLPEAIALSALSPVIGTLLAVPVLGEYPRPLQLVAVVLGTIGALLVLQPGSEMFRPTSLLPLVSAVSYASFEVTTRRIGRSEAAVTSLFYTAVIGLFGMGGWLTFSSIQPIGPFIIVAGIAIGLTGLAAHYFLIAALQRASVPSIAPISYTGLAWATLFGFVLFGHTPNLLAAIGMGVIGLGGLLLVERSKGPGPGPEPTLEAEVEAGTWADP